MSAQHATTWTRCPCTALLLMLALLLVGQPLTAQEEAAGFQTTYQREWVGGRQRVESIAGAIPEATYDWRPTEGVRSTSEVVMHIAFGNFMFAELLGGSRPGDLPDDLESVEGKTEVLALLGRSFDEVENQLDEVFSGDLDRELQASARTPYFSTQRDVLMRALAHSHEHGGQLVAYARMNGVVPPWSR